MRGVNFHVWFAKSLSLLVCIGSIYNLCDFRLGWFWTGDGLGWDIRIKAHWVWAVAVVLMFMTTDILMSSSFRLGVSLLWLKCFFFGIKSYLIVP